jgi:hypothetical protein
MYLTRPFAGPTTVQDIYIQIPVGYNATAYYEPSVAKWAWQRGQTWDQARYGKRIFTMCWYQDHVQGWLDTYSNGGCWDWLFSQQRAVAPTIAIQPQSMAVTAGTGATFTVTASGTAPLSYQWTRNGSIIGGAVDASYAIPATVAADNGATFIATVANYGGQAVSASATLTVNANANLISVVALGDHQVIQRMIGTTMGTVAVAGSYSGSPDRLQARVLANGGGAAVVDWSTVETAPSGGNYLSSLAVPQGGWYQLEVRSCDAAGNTLASAVAPTKWGVGINLLCLGQSNMLGFGDNAFTIADDRVGVLAGGTTWQHMADPWIAGGKASCGPALGNALVAALGIPVGLVPSAAGTTWMVGTSWNVLSHLAVQRDGRRRPAHFATDMRSPEAWCFGGEYYEPRGVEDVQGGFTKDVIA